ncbi:MAG: UDP-N-acetyl-D-mannosaminuronic acid dehydrogenase [Methanobacterium sp.]|jgi:UDP-N-acetyl-D-mannosaminuronic acid dehydrogenase|uniref:nucleotide sugar dehydrogenase n=1 Tax=Methanobacterium sp. TaxID=2164 RepID=UPI0003C96E0A|nr:nucleotide sugar dehydrogenase [Methanobacterium sp.]MDI3549504.1 UDP-N-acetyl-D-mannosaminuronic acid dehydrogenase [Methanobacterium sp.]CDG64795.1 UDP-N-acetyl-D-mannosamine dehydrogenase [Methanobacterium sp. MB1]
MIKENSPIAIFGLGHMGLPTAALLAKNGFKVVGIDINTNTVEMINSGQSPIMEPGLGDIVKETVENNSLSATTNYLSAMKEVNTVMIIVPTPVNENKESDLSAVIAASQSIMEGLKKDDLVIIESTVPPGTCENIVIPILEKSGLKAGQDFKVAYTPERALPNNTLYEMTHNARVIGGIDSESTKRAASLYQTITEGEIITVQNLVTAEMVKLMENTYRDTNIALANELALICDELGVDAIEAIQAANHHPRVNIHTPGPGVGGHCLSIDPYFLVEIARQKGRETPLIKASRQVNEAMPSEVVRVARQALEDKGKTIQGSRIGVLGVAYKGNVADARETPAKPLIKQLLNQGAAEVVVNDPYVSPELIKSWGVQPVDMATALDTDCVILVTDHDLYRDIKPEMIKNRLIICTRPILDKDAFQKNGVTFKGVGRS